MDFGKEGRTKRSRWPVVSLFPTFLRDGGNTMARVTRAKKAERFDVSLFLAISDIPRNLYERRHKSYIHGKPCFSPTPPHPTPMHFPPICPYPSNKPPTHPQATPYPCAKPRPHSPPSTPSTSPAQPDPPRPESSQPTAPHS